MTAITVSSDMILSASLISDTIPDVKRLSSVSTSLISLSTASPPLRDESSDASRCVSFFESEERRQCVIFSPRIKSVEFSAASRIPSIRRERK